MSFVFHDCKLFNIEALRVVVRTNGVDEIAGSNQVTAVTLFRTDDELFGIGANRIRVIVENCTPHYPPRCVAAHYPEMMRL